MKVELKLVAHQERAVMWPKPIVMKNKLSSGYYVNGYYDGGIEIMSLILIVKMKWKTMM